MRRCVFLMLVLALFGIQSAAAKTFCVAAGDSAALVNDLKYFGADTNANDVVYIHLEEGSYALSGEYDGTAASLHIVGGFVPGSSCKQRVVDAAATTVHGSSVGAYWNLSVATAEMLIDGVTLSGFGQGVSLYGFDNGSITVRNVIVHGIPANAGVTQGALALDMRGSGSSLARVENCLIYGNGAPAGLAIVAEQSGNLVEVLNCTIADNASYGLYLGNIEFDFAGSFFGYNNIVYGNPAGDINVSHVTATPTFDYSDFHGLGGSVNGTHNVDKPPAFVGSGPRPYALDTSSLLINAGATANTVANALGQTAFTYATQDIAGHTRVTGSHIDLGAYESNINDLAQQVVTSNADNGANTLRAAITAANLNANPTTITFNIPGSCPLYIELSTLLPDITSDITIDGYTQPGASVNTTAPGYNGNLCIVLYGDGQDHGLQTSGSGRLTVRGIDFDDFSTAAIELGSGQGHIIAGNGFGLFPDFVGNNKVGVLISGLAKSSQIGSFAFGDRNAFNGSTDAAIKLLNNGAGDHVIQGNYIGFDLDGTPWSLAPNKYGIVLQNSANNQISYNDIGGSTLYALQLTGAGTSGNSVFENGIGFAPADNSAAGNGTGGSCALCFAVPAVDITTGAHDNHLGTSGGNYIVDNPGGGVFVEANAGTGNRIYGNNSIHDNGGNLAIDLGGFGPTANDIGDADTGGNGLQNYPQLAQAIRERAGSVRISGALATAAPAAAQTYRLDFYWTDACHGDDGTGPRGDLKRYVGFANLPANGVAYAATFSGLDLATSAVLPTGPTNTGYLVAIATDAAGSTSEPGPCVAYIDDYIFADNLDGP